MILLFHTLMFAIKELSTPVWQNEVRQITQQVVEAMCEAEKKLTVSLESVNFARYRGLGNINIGFRSSSQKYHATAPHQLE